MPTHIPPFYLSSCESSFNPAALLSIPPFLSTDVCLVYCQSSQYRVVNTLTALIHSKAQKLVKLAQICSDDYEGGHPLHFEIG